MLICVDRSADYLGLAFPLLSSDAPQAGKIGVCEIDADFLHGCRIPDGHRPRSSVTVHSSTVETMTIGGLRRLTALESGGGYRRIAGGGTRRCPLVPFLYILVSQSLPNGRVGW